MFNWNLKDKVAIVTGSSRGIGKATALALAAHGANVVISSRKLDACQLASAEINEVVKADVTTAIAANISSKAALEALVAQTRARYGRIDILVCNAATNPYFGPMSGLSDESFQKILTNNVVANHWLIQMVAPEMLARRSGSIILISSVGGMFGTSVLGAYNLSKAADFQLARNLSHEFGQSNVRVNCISPGYIKTDFARTLWEDKARAELLNSALPLRRLGNADDIAGAAVFLASDASSYMTGQNIIIDGGLTVAHPMVS
jgi:NAD(P)-dependent dehydrogenase (short-subunit alcohol dehydrogenase family)